MWEQLRILYLLLRKNFIVRKRHTLGSIVELLIPACIIGLILVARSNYDVEPNHVKENTYFPLITRGELIDDHLQRSLFHLYYKPRNELTNNLTREVARCMDLKEHEVRGFDAEDELLENFEIQQGVDGLVTVLAIDFHNAVGPNVPKTLDYTIRSSQQIQNKLYSHDSDELSTASDRLIQHIPIVPLQMCLDDAFIDLAAPNRSYKPKIVIQKMPYPPYDTISGYELMIQSSICMFGGIIFFVTIYLIPTYVSAEKTSGVNTLLNMNGVKSYQNFFSWLITGMLFSVIPVFAVTGLVKLNLFNDQKPLYQYSNCSVIWLALFLNVTHVYAFCLHIASYFSKAWLAQMIATTLAVVTHMITSQIEDTCNYYLVPYLGLFCPTVATGRIFDELNKRENGQIGAHWFNIMNTANPALGSTGSLGFIMVFSVVGIVLHFVLALYLDAVLPNKYGVQKSPLFFLKHSKNNKVCNSYEPTQRDSSDGRPKLLEPVTEGAFIPGIELRNLAKCFTCGCFKAHQAVEAVRGVSVDFYKGQITALLGHNGAGKTTTFSILTGLTAPTRGTVYINGKDLSQNLDEIRSDLGVCPQENTMFPDLTVLEQVRLVGLLKQKNRTKQQLLHDVDELLDKLDMTEKRNVMPDKLSGGQKRRLCLAMALIGNASTLFLDEPTSGMDPETSRGTWDIILKYRKQKTIIITTHSMEEADVLGDRIAIMDSGHVKCYGTPMFLKKHYGHNYHEVTLSTTSWCSESKIREIVGGEAKMNTTHRGRIVVTIPLTSSLPELLDDIENQKAALGITGVSVSTMTLEEVFLKAAKDEGTNESVDDVDGCEKPLTKSYKHLTGLELTVQRIKALLTKKLRYLDSNKNLLMAIILGALFAVVLPVLCISKPSAQSNIRLIDLGLYQTPEALIYSTDHATGETYKKVVESQGGIGSIVKGKDGLTNELLSRAKLDLVYYKTRIITSAEFNSSSIANGFYSGGAAFSAPITVNAMSNLVLKIAAGEEYSIVAKIGDLPRSLKQSAGDATLNRVNIMIGVILFSTVFFHVVALFVKHPLMENITKIKQLQQMAGASPILYWGTMFTVDYVFYNIVTVLTVSGIYLLDLSQESNSIRLTEVCFLLILFLLFGINLLLVAYIHSFIRKRFHIVYSILSGVPLLLAFVSITLHMVLPFVDNAENANTLQRRMFSFLPHISFVFGYMKFTEIASSNARCRGLSNRLIKAACAVGDPCCDRNCHDGYCANPLPYIGNFSEEGGFEEFLLYLLLVPIILVVILCMLENQVFAKLQLMFEAYKKKSSGQLLNVNASSVFETTYQDRDKKIIDSEVVKEKSIVRQAINERASKQNPRDENVFLAHGLSKRYGQLEAVKEVNFRVTKNECFGLLGVNGAGKSTTFRMLVGEEIPTNGILYRGSHSIKSDRSEYLGGIGYCPQNDALIPCFDAIEHLALFAALRGVPESEIYSEVQMWIDKLQLNKHAKKPSETYSGGNKRRLNIAMALIASPKMVLLDEPTTGVDPAARRSVWTVLQSCQAAGQSIILTSHSMEECETLCNRLVVMVKGRLLCVGASQELKERFGAGFNITIKLNPGRSDVDFRAIKNQIEAAFTCELKDEHPGHLFYHITDPGATWVKMFGTMNDIKSNYNCVEDFTVSTSTLEQLFMQFARSGADDHKEFKATSQRTGPMEV